MHSEAETTPGLIFVLGLTVGAAVPLALLAFG